MLHYFWTIVILTILFTVQVYQWKVIFSLKKENRQIWDQISILVKNVAKELLDLKFAVNEKDSKKAK